MVTTKTKEDKKINGKVLHGVVVSDKMQDTVIVAITRFTKHPKYRKFIKSVKRYHAHNPNNEKKEGDAVTIIECKPISKTKRFTIMNG